EPSRYGSSQACLNLPLKRGIIGNSPKFIEPMFSEATSGLKVAAGRTRSSIDMVGAPPVVMLMTALELCLITLRNGANASGLWSGLPSFGSRACRCTTAAPASAAPIAASAISLAVIGICGDIDGVWIEPVTAQVMMTLRDLAIGRLLGGRWLCVRLSEGVCHPGPVPGIHRAACSGSCR